VSVPSPAEITWQFILIAKTPTQVDATGGTTKLAFTDPSEVSWIRLLAKDGLIEVIDEHGLVGIQGLTAKGALILNKAPDRETWIKVIGPIIEAGDSISLKAIDERRWHRRLAKAIKEFVAFIPR
jgi:hypothetical protein